MNNDNEKSWLFLAIWYLKSFIILRNHKETLKPSSLPSKQHLVRWYSQLSTLPICLFCTRCPKERQWIFTGLSQRFQVAGYLLLIAGEVASSHGDPPSAPQEVFEVQLLPFSKRHYRLKKAIFIKSTAIISGFTMITSLLKKTTTFWDTKIISFYLT